MDQPRRPQPHGAASRPPAPDGRPGHPPLWVHFVALLALALIVTTVAIATKQALLVAAGVMLAAGGARLWEQCRPRRARRRTSSL